MVKERQKVSSSVDKVSQLRLSWICNTFKVDANYKTLQAVQLVGSLLLAVAAAATLPAHAISSEAVASMAASKLPGMQFLRCITERDVTHAGSMSWCRLR